MRQPCMRFPGAAPRASAGTSEPVFAAHVHWTLWTLAGMTLLAESLLTPFVAHVTLGLVPASSRSTSTPSGVPFAATDAHILHFSLLILTFIEGAFAWVIVINTGQSVEAAPRAPDMDRRQHRPPRATWESPNRKVPHHLSRLRRPPTLPLALRQPLELPPLVRGDALRRHPQALLTGDGRVPRSSAVARMGPVVPCAEGWCSATFLIRVFVGAKGAARVFAPR